MDFAYVRVDVTLVHKIVAIFLRKNTLLPPFSSISPPLLFLLPLHPSSPYTPFSTPSPPPSLSTHL